LIGLCGGGGGFSGGLGGGVGVEVKADRICSVLQKKVDLNFEDLVGPVEFAVGFWHASSQVGGSCFEESFIVVSLSEDR
jgi:hypothetical protein